MVLLATGTRSLLIKILIVLAILLTVVSISPLNRTKMGFASANRGSVTAANQRHRIAHWLAFGSLAFLLSLLGRNIPQRLLTTASVAALGVLIELVQHALYHNPVETWDIRDDAYASLAGLLLALLAISVKRITQI